MSGELVAIAATYNIGEGIRITRHAAEKTNSGYAVLDDGVWTDINEINDDPNAIVTIVAADAGLIEEIAEECRMDLWCRLAGYGLV